YNRGQGVPQNFKEAVKWYTLAAKQGDAVAQNNLGAVYRDGEGVLQDYKEAVKWFSLSAEQGFSEAQQSLGHMYFNGNGVPQDFVRAHMWSNLAAANGHKEATENREILAEQMTLDQIAEAQKLAREWMEKHQDDGK
ncbi:MAG: sel1 repeat family protein, partial [Proteobacteria bacterium]|nr:sel1 repeat family protein [Pseudomonadota bacterium]